MDRAFWRGRRVLVTGHTGFKGSWLTTWLRMLQSEVSGYALEPDTVPSLFQTLGLAGEIDHVIADVRDRSRLADEVKRFAPEVVIHMAAQPIVRRSYREPIETYQTNVMGTAHLLEAVRDEPSVQVVVVVTTDKVYENMEQSLGYKEDDPLGGHDPYSSSKACAEILTASWRRSFFDIANTANVVSARAGNVIGGGDWSEDRIVPDAMRAFQKGETLQIRNPASTRPWQHVLEPLSGYLSLAEAAWNSPCPTTAVNFGPLDQDVVSVGELTDLLAQAWGQEAHVECATQSQRSHEANLLKLDCTHASEALGWRPRTDLRACVDWTVAWHRAFLEDSSSVAMRAFTEEQIRSFESIV